jgi:hypothetical protein
VATTIEQLGQRAQLERQLIARLRTANVRFTEAQVERIWAIVSAHQAGLSICKIAGATGLSSSRIHQLLNAPEAKEIPVWLSQLRQSSRGSGGKKKAERPESETEIQSCLAREVEVLRRCTDWLQRLEHGENVVVNLRPDEDVETEFVAFDRLRVVRVLERIAADLDTLSLEERRQQIEQLKVQRKANPKHIEVKDLPEQDRFQRLRSEKKHFIDTIKLIAYRAETALAELAREKIKRLDDARSLIRQLFRTEIDLLPDRLQKTLTVRLHSMSNQVHDEIVRHICQGTKFTETVFPGTDLRLIYEIYGSPQIPRDLEV